MTRINDHFIVYEELPSYQDFYENVMKQNVCCLFNSSLTASWKCRQEWTTDGNLDLKKLETLYGSRNVPVYDCDQQYFNSNPCSTMLFTDFCKQITEGRKNLYLKDWHFFQEVPNSGNLYEVPIYFESDYLNQYCIENNKTDYRFVYIGPKNSSTPLHVDVFGSFSWSANVSGKKRWLMIPPTKANLLKSIFKELPNDLYQSDDRQSLFQKLEAFEIIQNTGEVLFVPSGYTHQVINLEDTVSINHNWLNACNLVTIYHNLMEAHKDVQNELADIRDQLSEEEWSQQCQQVLLIHFGMNLEMFVSMLVYIHRRSKETGTPFTFRSSHDESVIADLLKQIT